MSGWRDENGRTAADRGKLKSAEDRARLGADVRHRPLTLLKRLAGFVLVTILALAVIAVLR